MTNSKKVEELEKQVIELKRKLFICTKWMRREVEDQVHKIARKKISKLN